MREIIIGDIHGCCRALEGLLAKISPDPERDRLILLGDLFDRGPESWEVFQKAKALAEAFGDRFVLLRGNHEDYLLTEKLTLGQRLMWDRVGRGATARSFKAHGARMEDSAEWLRARCLPFWRREGFQCAHAGVRVNPLEANDRETLIHDHEAALENIYAGPLKGMIVDGGQFRLEKVFETG